MKKSIVYISLLAGLSLTSCNDFLELKPLNEIVLENYWTEKADVESVVFGCYSGMETQNFLTRIYAYGDMRSDDIVYSKSANSMDVRMIIEENILETNGVLNWESIYQVINRCNTVIHYAPEVAEKDPNYTEAEMRANIAEVTWIRTLCYFYLARTFRDIPYVTEPSLNDDDIETDYRVAPTPFKEVLTKIAADLEAVKGDALRFYPPKASTNSYITNPYNTSRVTTCAMHALLADIYLWLDDYNKVLEHTQQVFDYKMYVYDYVREEDPSETRDIKLMGTKYPLILEMLSGSTSTGNAFTQIFGQGNSFESIFELSFESHESGPNPLFYLNNNPAIFDNSSRDGLLCAYKELTANLTNDANKYFRATDNRGVEYFETTETRVSIRKHYYQRASFTPSKSGTAAANFSYSTHSGYQNWIIYRLSDIMLMRAEALTELGGDENLAEAFELVSAIYNRANNLTEGETNCLKADNYKTLSDMRQLVRDERHRELMFEGKRWYDLVRYALRDGYNTELIAAVIKKQETNANRIRIQLQTQDALFWPYAEREIDLNPYLTQNSAYITNETSQK